MRRFFLAAGGALVAASFSIACGGGSGNPSTPSTPSNTPISISIVGDRGNQSFAPNPAQDSGVGQAVWRNSDGQVHRIVANDGSFDTGELNPGATSSATRIPAEGTNYHCSLHPGMVGAIRSRSGNTPACTGQYC